MKKIQLGNDEAVIFKKIMKIQTVINRIISSENKVLIYGGNRHTFMFLDYIDIPTDKIRICDRAATGTINKIEIEKPTEEVLGWSDYIIVSSFYSMNSICDYIKKLGYSEKVITLYSSEDKEPFYIASVQNCKLDESCINYGANPYTTWVEKGNGEKYEKNVEKNFFNTVTKQYFLENISANDMVLDVGAGTGRLSIECAKKGAKVTAVDTSADMLSILTNKDNSIKTIVVDDYRLPFEEGTFDKVVSCDAMVHFQNWREFVIEHKRVVKPGGLLIYNMVNDTHLQFISESRDIRSWYITGGSNRFASVLHSELDSFCQENNLELVSMYPYGFFVLTAYSYGILTREEMLHLKHSYMDLCSNENIAEIVYRFENEIVRNLPDYMCSSNMVILKKI